MNGVIIIIILTRVCFFKIWGFQYQIKTHWPKLSPFSFSTDFKLLSSYVLNLFLGNKHSESDRTRLNLSLSTSQTLGCIGHGLCWVFRRYRESCVINM